MAESGDMPLRTEFAWVGGCSSATVMLDPDFSRAFPSVDARIDSRLRLLWIACGTEDGLIVGNAERIVLAVFNLYYYGYFLGRKKSDPPV